MGVRVYKTLPKQRGAPPEPAGFQDAMLEDYVPWSAYVKGCRIVDGWIYFKTQGDGGKGSAEGFISMKGDSSSSLTLVRGGSSKKTPSDFERESKKIRPYVQRLEDELRELDHQLKNHTLHLERAVMCPSKAQSLVHEPVQILVNEAWQDGKITGGCFRVKQESQPTDKEISFSQAPEAFKRMVQAQQEVEAPRRSRTTRQSVKSVYDEFIGADGDRRRTLMSQLKTELDQYFEDLLANPINFEFGKDVIKRSSDQRIQDIADMCKQVPQIELTIHGHIRGQKPYDQLSDVQKKHTFGLAYCRARAVKNMLLDKGVVNQMIIKSWGDQHKTSSATPNVQITAINEGKEDLDYFHQHVKTLKFNDTKTFDPTH